jgi:hypothetical protein
MTSSHPYLLQVPNIRVLYIINFLLYYIIINLFKEMQKTQDSKMDMYTARKIV